MKTKSQLASSAFSLTAIQIRKLIDACGTDRDRALIRLMAETGIRRQEAAGLKTSDIDANARLLIVRNGKGGKRRMIPVTKVLIADMAKLMVGIAQDLIFTSRQSSALSLRQINRIVAQVGLRAGINHPNPKCTHITCHLLRHTFARLWKAEGGSIETLSKILGHSSVKTTWDVYGTESLPDIQRNYDSTIDHIFTKSRTGNHRF